VKRFDTYLIYVVTYTLFSDVKSKLVVWMVIAAVMLAIQCGALPFDGWANGLADHVEIIGLMARFASLFLAMPAFLNLSETPQQLHQALDLLAPMLAAHLFPDVVTYIAAISACEKTQLWRQALDLLAPMRAAHFLPDVITYNAAIGACENAQP